MVGVESLPVAGVAVSASTELMVGTAGAVVSIEKVQTVTVCSLLLFLTVAVAV